MRGEEGGLTSTRFDGEHLAPVFLLFGGAY